MSSSKVTKISRDSNRFFFEQNGKVEKATYTYYRGDHANFSPSDDSLASDPDVLKDFVRGLTPPAPFLDKQSCIVAFGSCFASHIGQYLKRIGYLAAANKGQSSYVSLMGDGIVNTYALRQQFEWAWESKQPQSDLWHGYDAKRLGYDESVRLDTKALFDDADAFIITLGLSEIWYDEPTGEVFWRAVPTEYFDPARHKFRVASYQENLDNLLAIRALIRRHRPDAAIIFTLSPIPLTATFRPIPCVVANSASKAILRSALDQFYRAEAADANLYYFPSFEIAQCAFDHPFMEDRKHIHKHVLDLNMSVFERYYCKSGVTDEALLERYRAAQALDRVVTRDGHWAVPRANLLFHPPPPGAKTWDAPAEG